MALLRRNAGPIIEYCAPDISVSFGPSNTIGRAFNELHLAQLILSAALSRRHPGKSMQKTVFLQKIIWPMP
jgi:hypothetical protein